MMNLETEQTIIMNEIRNFPDLFCSKGGRTIIKLQK